MSAVCHGPGGLLNVKLSNVENLIKGKEITGFSWPEEVMTKREMAVLFQSGGGVEEERREAPYGHVVASYVREDGRLITGQNPVNARAVGEAVAEKLKAG